MQLTALCRSPKEAGIEDAVREVPERLPYLRALRNFCALRRPLIDRIRRTTLHSIKDLPGPDGGPPLPVPVSSRQRFPHAVLKSSGGGLTLTFETDRDLETLEDDIANCLRILVMEPDRLGRADPAAWAPFTAQAIASGFAEIFNHVASRASAGAALLVTKNFSAYWPHEIADAPYGDSRAN